VGFLERLEARAAAVGGRVALAEGHDDRIVEAAGELVAGGRCEVTLVCPGDQRKPIHDELAGRGVDVADPIADPRREQLADYLHQRRAAKGMSREEALAAVEDPLYFASLMVATGAADASVGGAVRTTADTVRAALHCIGPAPGLRTVSSAFIMIHPDPRWGEDGVMVFADCAVLPDPDSVQLAEIALSAAATFRSIVGGEPKVALLSFSTNGSAKHPLVDKVTAARAELETRGADFVFDGELQLASERKRHPGRLSPERQTYSFFLISTPEISPIKRWSVWVARVPWGRSCRGSQNPPTTSAAAVPRAISCRPVI